MRFLPQEETFERIRTEFRTTITHEICIPLTPPNLVHKPTTV